MSSVLHTRTVAGQGLGAPWRWLPVAAGLAALYVPTYAMLWQTLWREDAHAHGPLVLAIVAWLVWRERAALLEGGEGRAPYAGAILLAAGLLTYVVGRSQGIALFEVGSHIPVLAGTVLALRGWRVLVRLSFPLFFLVFLVPLPGFVIDAVTGPLKAAVSEAVESILYGFGYPIARTGVMLSIGQYQLLVADACSGLNSLYSLAALGFLYAYVTKGRGTAHNALMLAAIVPIAIAANLLRVLLLVLITFHFGDAAGQSFLHEFAGITLFATALALLFAFDAAVQRVQRTSLFGRGNAP